MFCEELCELVSYLIIIIIVVLLYRYYTKDKKNGFMDSGGCGSCQYLAKNLNVTATST